ncbi:MAG TPA: hypothetical protein VEY51_05155, partial [Chondromyces sp.]|nr:hypothetical protein [Chondromyces sp.]
AYRVADVSEIQLDWLKGAKTAAVTAGASTPTPIVREVIQFLEAYDSNDESTWERKKKVPLEKILPKIKNAPLKGR